MLVILDTDHLTILQDRNPPDCEKLEQRLSQLSSNDVVVTIISFQEQAQGWLSRINHGEKEAQVLRGYDKLRDLIIEFGRLTILPFGESAQIKFKDLVRQRLRVGTLDLRIASIVLVNNGMLLSRNLKDFRKIPGLRVEDWTREQS